MTKKLTFYSALKQYGVKRVVGSYGSLLAFIITSTLVIGKVLFGSLVMSWGMLLEKILTYGVGLFSVSFATFAVVAALSDKDFIRMFYLTSSSKFQNIYFQFWLTSGYYLVSILLCLVSLYFVQFYVGSFFGALGVLAFFLGLVETFNSVAAVVKFGLYRAKILDFQTHLKQVAVSDEAGGKTDS